MHRFSIAVLIFMVFTVFSCTDNDESAVSPVEPDILGDSHSNANQCRANMRVIASQQCIYYAYNGRYAATLEELGMAGTVCPECGFEYILDVSEGDLSIHCPLPLEPTHGSIVNGEASWTSPEGQDECRDNIRTIVCSNVIFYSENSRYADSLDELGFGSSTCPGCGSQYSYYTYDSGNSFFLSCPIPPYDCHGFFDSNTGYSWNEESCEAECRANMRTIASAEVIYFATNSTFTESMEDLGLAGMVCPACSEPYILQISGGGEEFYIECGLQSVETHGYIDNGVASWVEPTEE